MRRHHSTAPRFWLFAALCALFLAIVASPRPAHAQNASFGAIGIVVLGVGIGVGTASTITDLGITYHLATSDHVPTSWSKTGLVFSSIETVLATGLFAIEVDNLDSSGINHDLLMPLATGYLVHALGSLGLSIYGLTRRPPSTASWQDYRVARPTPRATPELSFAGIGPLVSPAAPAAPSGLTMSFRW